MLWVIVLVRMVELRITYRFSLSSWPDSCMHAKLLQSCLTLCNPMDSSLQAPLSTGFSRQEYWSGLPFPSPKEKDEQYLIKDGILIQIKFPNVFHTSVLNIGGTEERPHI